MNKQNCAVLLLIIFVVIVIVFGVSTDWTFSCKNNNDNDNDFKKCSEQYQFVSDKLDCGNINEKIEQVADLDQEIEKYINKEENNGNVKQVSVMFRDLKSFRWFGVNENVKFYPASLSKLPISMMFYKAAEVNDKLLSVNLEIKTEDAQTNDGQHFRPKENLEAGKSYPVQELIRRILTYSDNAPLGPLLDASESFHESVLSDLGIFSPAQEGEEDGTWNVTAKTYANLFRILYNASYLRPEYSNRILSQLADSEFNSGIIAGVPKDTRVAHKFGETLYRDDETGSFFTILNDCGIIYKRENPYILCIMTEG